MHPAGEVTSVIGDGDDPEGVPIVRHQQLVPAVRKWPRHHHLPVLNAGGGSTHAAAPIVAHVAPGGRVLEAPVVVLLAAKPRVVGRLCCFLAVAVEGREKQLTVLKRDSAARLLFDNHVRGARPGVRLVPWLGRVALLRLLHDMKES